MAEDHGLGNGDSAVDITESLELLISVIAQNVILLNSVQCLLLSLQFDNVWKHLAVLGEHSSLPLNADALVLMALGCYHHVSLIQDEHFDFLGIYEFQFGTPVQHSAGCHFTLLTFIASDSICKFQLWIKLSHLFNHFSCLKCQLVCWGKPLGISALLSQISSLPPQIPLT
uniref:Uncharacterized protein n=1 Tax=Aquila chrysaetos chrysaetos TaxID=223781 RepID=A0A663DP95_AQUCH